MIAAASVAATAPEERRELRHPRHHHDRGAEGRRHRADQDVAVLDVRQLVREHPFEFLVRQHPQHAFRRGDGGVLGVASGGERVGRRIGNHIAARLRQAGAFRQPIHGVEQAMAGEDFLRVVHAEDNLVREPVRPEVGGDREEESGDHAAGAAEHFADEHGQRAERPEEQRGLDGVGHEFIVCV